MRLAITDNISFYFLEFYRINVSVTVKEVVRPDELHCLEVRESRRHIFGRFGGSKKPPNAQAE